MRVSFSFADGARYSVDCGPEETVLAAARRADVPLLFQCESGACATCSARLVAGNADMLEGSGASLLPSEAAEGLRLTCRCIPRGDCEFALAYDSVAGTREPERYESNIDDIEWVAANVVRLRLALPDDDWFDFVPGQFVQVRVPGTGHWRSYSMASGPGDMPTLELLIRVLDHGVMSDYLRDEAEAGDLVELEGPYGSFQLQKSKAPHIFVAGGTGLAPFLSMLDRIRTYSGTKPELVLIFGCADGRDVFCVDTLEDAAYMLPKLRTRITADTHADPAAGVLAGNPVAHLEPADVVAPGTTAYLCGPPAMVDAARQRLLELGLPSTQIIAEQFVATD